MNYISVNNITLDQDHVLNKSNFLFFSVAPVCSDQQGLPHVRDQQVRNGQ